MLKTVDTLPDSYIKKLYGKFFEAVPDQENPTDMNTQEKWLFMKSVGFFGYRKMINARKRGKPWTKRSYWKGTS